MLPVLPQILNGQLLDMIENKQLDQYLSEIWDATPGIVGDKPSESDTRNLRKKLIAHYETLDSDKRAAWQAPKLKLEDVVDHLDKKIDANRIDPDDMIEKLRGLVPAGQLDEAKVRQIIDEAGAQTQAMMLKHIDDIVKQGQANNQQANNQQGNQQANNQQGNQQDEQHGKPGYLKGVIDGLFNRSGKH